MSKPVGYEQTQRIWRLITLLRTPGGSLKTLAIGCEASIHTTRKDLQFLRAIGMKIEKTPLNTGNVQVYSVVEGSMCPSCAGELDG